MYIFLYIFYYVIGKIKKLVLKFRTWLVSGRIFAKGKSEDPECSKVDFSTKRTKKPHFDLPLGMCGMKSLRSVGGSSDWIMHSREISVRSAWNVLRNYASDFVPHAFHHQSWSSVPREVLFRRGKSRSYRRAGSQVCGSPLHCIFTFSVSFPFSVCRYIEQCVLLNNFRVKQESYLSSNVRL